MNTETLNAVLAATAALSSSPSVDPLGKYLQIAEVIRHAESIRQAERKLYIVLNRYTPEIS